MFQPLNDRLIIHRLPEPGKPTEGKRELAPGLVVIITPESALQASQYGEVLAVGPGKMLDTGERAPIGVSVGDRLWFGRYNDYDFDERLTGALAGESLVVVQEADIVAVESLTGGTPMPVLNHVLIRREERKTQQGAIIIPDTAQADRYTGTVLAVGPGYYAKHNGRFVQPCVQAGQRVLWGENLGRFVTLDRVELYLLRDSDLFAVLPEGADVELAPERDPAVVVAYDVTEARA